MIINSVLSLKEFVLMIHVVFVKPNVIRWNEHNNPTKNSEP